MIDLHGERETTYFYVGNRWLAYASSLVFVGMALAVYAGAGQFLSYDPTDPELIQKVRVLRMWAIPALLFAPIPILFTLSQIRIDDGGIAFRRLIRWSCYTWPQLQRAELRYCESCRCLEIDCDGRKRKYPLAIYPEDDRQRLFDQLALGGVVAGPFEKSDHWTLHPFWSGTSYEFNDDGVTVVTKNNRRLCRWDDIPSGCIETLSSQHSVARSISLDLEGEPLQLCQECCHFRGETSCRCSVLRPVAELMQDRMRDDRLTVAVRSQSLAAIETEEDLDRYEKHHRAGFWEVRVVFVVMGALFALMPTVAIVVGVITGQITDADRLPELKRIALLGFLGGSFVMLVLPLLFKRLLLGPIHRRRKELEEQKVTSETTEQTERGRQPQRMIESAPH